jgi:hypothetical protein
MRRGILVVLVGLCLLMLACGAGAWTLQESMIQPYVLPGATNVVVTSHGINSLSIAYRADGRPYAWRDTIAHQLAVGGWRSRDYVFGVTRTFTVTWYARTTTFGPFSILESAVVGGDPRDPYAVHVEVNRELHIEQ